MTKELKAQIQKEYEAITSFKNGEVKALADKYNITLDELWDIIDL